MSIISFVIHSRPLIGSFGSFENITIYFHVYHVFPFSVQVVRIHLNILFSVLCSPFIPKKESKKSLSNVKSRKDCLKKMRQTHATLHFMFNCLKQLVLLPSYSYIYLSLYSICVCVCFLLCSLQPDINMSKYVCSKKLRK